MGHYFTNEELADDIRTINETIMANNYTFMTNSGVFSKEHVDLHSKLLVEHVLTNQDCNKVLDLGCGYGVIGIVIAKHFNISVDMLDVNARAVELAKHNCEVNDVNCKVFVSDGFNDSQVANDYDTIVLNPPIRAGKELCYHLYQEAHNHLVNNGSLFIVIHKKHGAKSTIDFLTSLYTKVEILYKKKGLFIVKTTK